MVKGPVSSAPREGPLGATSGHGRVSITVTHRRGSHRSGRRDARRGGAGGPRRQLQRLRVRRLRQPVVEQLGATGITADESCPGTATMGNAVGAGARIPFGATGTTTFDAPSGMTIADFTLTAKATARSPARTKN